MPHRPESDHLVTASARSRSRVFSAALVATLGAALGAGGGTASAQSPDNFWVTSPGGLWNQASNWNLNFVPGPTDMASLLLPGDFNIFASGVDVDRIQAEAGTIDLTVGSSRSFGTILVRDELVVTGGDATSGAASLMLRGRFGFSSLRAVGVAGSRLGPQFGTGVGHEAVIELLFAEPLSTLRFEVNESSPFLCPASMTVVSLCEAVGGFHLSGDQGFLRPGDSYDLIDATLAGDANLPRFGLVESPRSVDVDMIIDRRTNGTYEGLRVKSQPADTQSELDVVDGFDLIDEAIDLLILDVDRDGLRDVVVATSSGKHPVFLQTTTGFQFETLFESPPPVRAATVGDFDDDGWDDLAFASVVQVAGVDQTGLVILRNDTNYESGPSLLIEDLPVSLAAIQVPSSNLLNTASRGVAVTGIEATTGRSKTRGYETTETEIIKTGEIEVGDDPGPSDPIEDENKKDPDPPLGVAGNETALVDMPVLRVLTPTASGFSLERAIRTSGRIIDFDSGDIDDDGRIETLVLTDSGRLDLLRPLDSNSAVATVPVGPGTPVAVRIGNLDGDSRREVVVLRRLDDGSSSVDVFRVDPIEVESSTGPSGRSYLERRREVSLDAGMSGLALVEPGDGLVTSVGLENDPTPEPFLLVQSYATRTLPDCAAADLNGDGRVDSEDLGRIFEEWGPCGSCPGDFNGDGRVDAADVGFLFANWGPC